MWVCLMVSHVCILYFISYNLNVDVQFKQVSLIKFFGDRILFNFIHTIENLFIYIGNTILLHFPFISSCLFSLVLDLFGYIVRNTQVTLCHSSFSPSPYFLHCGWKVPQMLTIQALRFIDDKKKVYKRDMIRPRSRTCYSLGS